MRRNKAPVVNYHLSTQLTFRRRALKRMENNMNTIDALKRLERAGNENSKATKKLHEAAEEMALVILKKVPADVTLPRDYRKVRVTSNVGEEYFLVLYRGDIEYWIDGTGSFLHGDFHAEIPAQTREGSLTFAHDIATGLVDEIAELLEERSREAGQASDLLERAK